MSTVEPPENFLPNFSRGDGDAVSAVKFAPFRVFVSKILLESTLHLGDGENPLVSVAAQLGQVKSLEESITPANKLLEDKDNPCSR